ncbi:hypothetical protein D3C78_607480 [compost metagenome]
MANESSQEDRAAVLRMIRAGHGPFYWLLELPDGRWAAFWKQGFEIDHCTALANGEFHGDWPCAYISDNRYDVESWIEDEREEMRCADPLNAVQF